MTRRLPLAPLLLALPLALAPVVAGGAERARFASGPPAPSPEALAARGLRSGARFPGLAGLCRLSGGTGALPDPAGLARPARPVRVFDDLFFVGTPFVSSWVIDTSAGLIVIDALQNDAESRAFIAGGLERLGLDPKRLRVLIVTHAHGDHFGGQGYLVRTFRPRVVMGEADWAELERGGPEFANPAWGPPPKRDVAVRGEGTVTLGGTTVRLLETPGHTPGTLSLIFTVRDRGARHTVALWGGTGLDFGPDAARLRAYSASAERFGREARRAGVDVFLSNHPFVDGSLRAAAGLAARGAGDPHPLVAGEEALGALDLLRDCSLARALEVERRARR